MRVDESRYCCWTSYSHLHALTLPLTGIRLIIHYWNQRGGSCSLSSAAFKKISSEKLLIPTPYREHITLCYIRRQRMIKRTLQTGTGKLSDCPS